MNYSKILFAGAFVSMALVSCTNENDYLAGSTDKGTMVLAVEQLRPTPKYSAAQTRAVETADFPVTVYNKADGQEVLSYAKASMVPNKVVMPVGEYYAVAHTPGEMDKIMSTPYYRGTEDFQILKAVSTVATITCRMANSSFKINYSSDFASVFSSWTVTVDDGSATALIYTNDLDGLNPAIKYMAFEENVSALRVNFRGTTSTGTRIVTTSTLTKGNATEGYDGDSEYFTGGEALVLNFSPVESTEGDITGINLSANIRFEESEEDFDLEVEDVLTDGGETGGEGGGETGGEGGGETGGNPDAITLDLPENMTLSPSTDPALGNTYIAAAAGLKSVQVKISSTSDAMMESLAALGVNYGVNFATGAEVVGNQDLVTLFSDLGQTLEVPAEGDTEYVFPIGNFFSLLLVLPGDHTFYLTVTDKNGNVKSGELVLGV